MIRRLMTTVRAKECFCPFDFRVPCLAQQCMAWRFNTSSGNAHRERKLVRRLPESDPSAPPPRPADVPERWRWEEDDSRFIETQADAEERTLGYCARLEGDHGDV